MMTTAIMMNGRVLRPHKARVSPSFSSRSVLTREPWAFVRLSLKRERQDEALFYWDQAKVFHDAGVGLPLESAPLLLYYSFMNAAKALLAAKKVPFSPYHGVKEWRSGSGGRDWLKRIGVEFKAAGVISSLAQYLGDAEASQKHTLQELFFNMAFVHRTYCLTYRNQRDMFVPVRECAFVRDPVTGEASLSAQLSQDHSSKKILSRLPPTLATEPSRGPSAIRSVASVKIAGDKRLSESDLSAIAGLHRGLRLDLFYINGTQTLWYVKLNTKGPSRLARHTPTLALAAMHRLSELCRYRPMDLVKYLAGPMNWLIHEFIGESPTQYIDEIASELTGHQFLIPNARPAA